MRVTGVAGLCAWLTWLILCMAGAEAKGHSKEAYKFIMVTKKYNKLIRPSGVNNRLVVRLGLRFSQIIKVDEKNQVLTTNAWLKQEWYDLRLTWNPDDFGGETELHIPSEELWIPDIVVYNNADGDFVITMLTKATVYYDGRISWEPPAIYKTYCPIDVEYFPFDTQLCFMKFGSWTYDGNQVDLIHFCQKFGTTNENGSIFNTMGIDLKGYSENSEWDVLNVTATKTDKVYPCCPEPYPDITFRIKLRRNPQFYAMNLIAPCVSISFLTVLVFYLPSVSGEKMTLSISILLAMTVFFMLLSEITPTTSLVIPLIGKYLLFTMLLVTASLLLTVYVLNLNYRTTTTHSMSDWVRLYFMEKLPTFLNMRRPQFDDDGDMQPGKMSIHTVDGFEMRESSVDSRLSSLNTRADVHTYENMQHTHQYQHPIDEPDPGKLEKNMESMEEFAIRELEELISNVEYIASTKKDVEEGQEAVRDWAYIAQVFDRGLLIIFSFAFLAGTGAIILNAPALYDTKAQLTPQDFFNISCTY